MINEELLQQNYNYGIAYKIKPETKYKIFKREFQGSTYYSISVPQKMADGTTKYFYKRVLFKRDVSVPNAVFIVIHKAFENLRPNKKDDYNPISELLITEFDIVDEQEIIEKTAFAEYRDALDDDSLPF